MARIGFVACSKTKGDGAMPAAALYRSPLFRKSLLAALDGSDKVYILSAKHGVLSCSDVIEPYDVTLKTMPLRERKEWGVRVAPQLAAILRPRDTAVLYCGEEYVTPLRAPMQDAGVALEMPLGSLPLGGRLQMLAAMNGEAELRRSASEFAHLMRRLWMAQEGGRRLAEASGRLSWPGRGVYFFLEADRGLGGGRMPRIVRVGTHAVSQGSKTTLWNRLSTHRGTAAGGGSHRSSIFRLHAGRALARRMASPEWPSTWGRGQSAPQAVRGPEQPLEREVSGILGAMRVVWLDVPDKPGAGSERAYLERNAIGLLSRVGLLDALGSPDWLGRWSPEWRIATSGLWNLNHVFAKPAAAFMQQMAVAVSRTIGREVTVRSGAPEASTELQLGFADTGKVEWR